LFRYPNASINSVKRKDLVYNFSLSLNSSSGLNIDKNQLKFSPNDKSSNVSVSASRVTSRAYIDIQSCIESSTQQPCSFNVSDIFVTVTVSHSRIISILVIITGWIYFFAWSISFYPQIVLNFQRKSVEGLNFDFLVLNIIGFFCYSVYNVLMYFDPEVQDLYIEQDPRAQIPVLLNDVVFALHALFACIVTGLQCFLYERGSQRISFICMGWSTVLLLFAGGSLIATLFKALNWLRFISFLSHVKLAVTCSKYFPQAILNFRRKSTVGWSIGNVLLDFTGGTMDIVQMVLQGFNTNDWTAFYGNPVKFGLGLISMIFDILFMIQHYILYRNSESYEISHDTNESTETIVPEPTPNEYTPTVGEAPQQNYH